MWIASLIHQVVLSCLSMQGLEYFWLYLMKLIVKVHLLKWIYSLDFVWKLSVRQYCKCQRVVDSRLLLHGGESFWTVTDLSGREILTYIVVIPQCKISAHNWSKLHYMVLANTHCCPENMEVVTVFCNCLLVDLLNCLVLRCNKTNSDWRIDHRWKFFPLSL